MGQSSSLTKDLPGASFGKMLGTGAGNGFSIFPDLSLYGLLLIWPDVQTAKRGLSDSAELRFWFEDATSYGTLFMETCKVHGTWDGKQPFDVATSPKTDMPVAVLTRATIKKSHLFSFWKDVPSVSKSLNHSPEGLYSANGVGERPHCANYDHVHEYENSCGYVHAVGVVLHASLDDSAEDVLESVADYIKVRRPTLLLEVDVKRPISLLQ